MILTKIYENKKVTLKLKIFKFEVHFKLVGVVKWVR